MTDFFFQEHNAIQIALWLIAVIVTTLVGPARWKIQSDHIAELRVEIDDLTEIVARLREEITRLKEDCLAIEQERDYLISLRRAARGGDIGET
jgi:hypothetical protein